MAEVNLKVFGARAIIKLDEKENKTLGGIILPEQAEDPVNKGVVVAVGEGARLENGTKFPMEIAVGDVIIFSPMAGAPVEVEGDDAKYLVINEGDVLAVVE